MFTFILIVLSISLILLIFLFGKREKIMFGRRKTHKEEHRHDRNSRKHKTEVMAGELIVISEDEVHIELPKRPKEVLAVFGKYCNITPCNPRHFDLLKCYVCRFHKRYCLVIKWNVSNLRKIKWEVIF